MGVAHGVSLPHAARSTAAAGAQFAEQFAARAVNLDVLVDAVVGKEYLAGGVNGHAGGGERRASRLGITLDRSAEFAGEEHLGRGAGLGRGDTENLRSAQAVDRLAIGRDGTGGGHGNLTRFGTVFRIDEEDAVLVVEGEVEQTVEISRATEIAQGELETVLAPAGALGERLAVFDDDVLAALALVTLLHAGVIPGDEREIAVNVFLAVGILAHALVAGTALVERVNAVGPKREIQAAETDERRQVGRGEFVSFEIGQHDVVARLRNRGSEHDLVAKSGGAGGIAMIREPAVTGPWRLARRVKIHLQFGLDAGVRNRAPAIRPGGDQQTVLVESVPGNLMRAGGENLAGDQIAHPASVGALDHDGRLAVERLFQRDHDALFVPRLTGEILRHAEHGPRRRFAADFTVRRPVRGNKEVLPLHRLAVGVHPIDQKRPAEIGLGWIGSKPGRRQRKGVGPASNHGNDLRVLFIQRHGPRTRDTEAHQGPGETGLQLADLETQVDGSGARIDRVGHRRSDASSRYGFKEQGGVRAKRGRKEGGNERGVTK